MRLKSIKILGFKSFADKVGLEFHPGITGIVGPNGCGKSNISDAFRWVLGETSAKSLRGKKMEDVIFAGTTTRKPLNIVEVCITLTDIAGQLPIDYEEVEIVRRYHRSGESEYLINRQPVRMKDIQSLLMDTGIGKSAFSIFEQGKIDQIIQFSPQERRAIFEEAAGILRFLQRKREALRKLEMTDSNISRVKDIHKEVEKQIVVLERQAEEARLFKERKARLENLEKGVIVSKWDFLSDKKIEFSGRIEEKKALVLAANGTIEELVETLKEAKASLIDAERSLRARSEEVYQARSEKEIKARERQSNQERMKEMMTKESRWRETLEGIIEKKEFRKTEASKNAAMKGELKVQHTEQEKVLQEQQRVVSSLESELFSLRERQHVMQNERMHHLKAESESESALKQSHIRLESSEERHSGLLERQRQVEERSEALKPKLEEKTKEVEALSLSVDEQKKGLEACESELEHITEEITATQKTLDEIHTEHMQKHARHAALKRLREENEGFSVGSKELLKEASHPKSALYGKLKGLYEYISSKSGLEKAFSALLRPYTQTLVVEKIADFEAVLHFAKQKKLQDFSLFCLEHLQKNEAHTSGDLVSFLQHIDQSPVSRHFFQGALMAQDTGKAFTLAQAHPQSEIWVEDGAYLDRRQVLFYSSQGENNVFVREAELKVLETALVELEKRKEALSLELNTLQERRTVIQSRRLELDKTIRRSEMSLVESNFTLQRFLADFELFEKEKNQLHSELQILAEGIETLKAGIAELHQQHRLAKEKALLVQREAEELAEMLVHKESIFQQEKQILHDKQKSCQEMAEKLLHIEHELRVMEVQEKEGEEQILRLKEEIESSRDLHSQFKSKSFEYEKILADVEERLAEIVSACSGLEDEVNQRRLDIEKIEEKIAKENEQIKKFEADEHKFGIQEAQVVSVLTALETELQERYSMSVDEARLLGIVLERPFEQVEKEVRALRKELENAQGEINMTSIDEFDKHKARYQFLHGEISDMDNSKQELTAIIKELDDQSRSLFKETFELVRGNFKKNFQILFNGGEADLKFCEEDDVLEAGIEIIAKPPGKQMRSINLLSGGEKCMTALALLFAIFEVKPAPFCILDEIDAPLDDSNVERFVNVVKQFIDRCQFIIITHNKRTMAICDRLFGVSMQEKGVSKLLTMQFDHEAYAEPALVD